VLGRKRAGVKVERSSRKEPMTEAEVRALLRKVDTVILARGARVARLPAREARPSDLKGPTGNYRAPMVLRGRTLVVGFNAEALEDLF
jgi:hypothetical protein